MNIFLPGYALGNRMCVVARDALAYEDLAREAYARRMPEMRDPKRGAR